MPAIFPIPSGRISSIQIQRRMLAHLNSTQIDLLRIQNQLSTGRRIASPSDDPPAASRAVGLQRLLEQQQQIQTNLATSNSFLSAADTAISRVSQLLIDLRGTALTMADTTTTAEQRQAASVEIDRALEQLLSAANQKFRGRYLFAGSQTTTLPFRSDGQFVVYEGNESDLPSYVDLDLLLATNVSGNEVFGALSDEVRSAVDLNPVLTAETRLADLHGGLGIAAGSFVLSDGTSQSVVDIRGAETVGDVLRLIESNPPAGRRLSVTIASRGLVVDLDDAGGGNLTIKEFQNGTTAEELGILETLGTGTDPITGTDLNPRLRLTTSLDDVLGVRAEATLTFAAEAVLEGFADPGARVSVRAATPGDALRDVTIQLDPVSGLGVGNETATYSAANKTLLIQIDDAAPTSATNVAAAITNEGTFTAAATGTGMIDGRLAGDAAVTAVTDADRLAIRAAHPGTDMNDVTVSVATQAGLGAAPTALFDDVADTLIITIDDSGPTALAAIAAAVDNLAQFHAVAEPGGDANVDGTSSADTSATAMTAGGSGAALDQDSGIQIVNGGQTFVLTFQGAETIEDLLNVLNGSEASVLAEINQEGTGLNVRSRLSGADFHIGENGGTTATQLGIRTFTRATPLSQLNHGRGVEVITGTDLTISNNGVDLEIDLSSAQTIGDVLDLINDHPFVLARLVAAGNGIELVDTSPGGGQLTVTKAPQSNAARDLGLVAVDQDQAGPANPGGSLVGRDTNPLETRGVFNSLIRLNDAIVNFDVPAIERAIALLDEDISRVNFARAEIGARGQALDSLQQRVEDEQVQVRQTLSLEIDVDLVEAISNLTAQQAALEASLRLIGRTFQISLLDFL